MNKPYDRTPRITASGACTAAILLVSLAMGLSLLFDTTPADATSSTVAQAVTGSRG